MRKTMRLLCAGFAMMAVVSIGCSKDDDNASNKTKMELITTGTWKLLAFDMGVAGQFSPMLNSIPACERDNILTFRSNSTLTEDEGPTKCSPGSLQTTEGTWAFLNNETRISFETNALDVEGTIDRLDANTIVITEQENNGGVIVTYRLTLGK